MAGGQYVWNDTKVWNTVCAGDTCDWKIVYDTGDGHQVTALADNGRTTYAAWCGPCNPATGAPFDRGLATNYGGSWHELGLNGLPNRYITSIAADPADPAHVYITFGSYSRRWIPTAGDGHVFETHNGGATWTNVTGNLPDAPVYKVVIRGGQLIAGTEVGAFIAGRSQHPLRWSRLGQNLPNVTVWDLAVTRDSTTVVAGTHGRGQWTLRLPEPRDLARPPGGRAGNTRGFAAAYSSSVTWSPHVAFRPWSSTSSIARWVMNLSAPPRASDPPRARRTPGRLAGSPRPGRPRRWASPTPSVT